MVLQTIRSCVAVVTVAVCGCAISPTSPDPASTPVVEPATEVVDDEERPPKQLSADGVFYVLSSDPAKPAVRYCDGQRSLNETCAVQLGNKLNRRIPPAYVNGQPVGFC